MIRCKYYLDVLSQWCYIAEFALRKILSISRDAIDLSYVLVPIEPDALPSRSEQLRVYRRSRAISGIETQAWISDNIKPDTRHANAVVLAASLLGVRFEDVRRRVAEAALLHGTPLANPGEALTFVSREFGLDLRQLRDMADGPEVNSALEANRAAFIAGGISVRPSFHLSNAIGDHVVLGGQYDFGVINAAIQSLRADEMGYNRFEEEMSA